MGEYIDAKGYVRVYIGNTDRNHKFMKKHRLVIQNVLGRKLKSNEFIHHINGIKTDNRVENLELMTPEYHNEHHHTGKHHNEHRICYICKTDKTYLIKPSRYTNNTTICTSWHHTHDDKINWYCGRCYRRIWYNNKRAESIPEQRQL